MKDTDQETEIESKVVARRLIKRIIFCTSFAVTVLWAINLSDKSSVPQIIPKMMTSFFSGFTMWLYLDLRETKD